MRVQIPAYTDRWMMGDRYGEVIKTTRGRPGVRAVLLTSDRWATQPYELAHVRLDKSNKVVRVILADCTVV